MARVLQRSPRGRRNLRLSRNRPERNGHLSFREHVEEIMDQTTLAVVIGGFVVVLLAIVWLALQVRRSKGLRSHFGPEYDRLVEEKGSRRRAERELGMRERRVEHLPIRPLPRDVSNRFAQRWVDQQARFVDDPKKAVVEADRLVVEVMNERGYPTGDFEQRAADISVDHPKLVENYRAAHDITLREQRGQASTEDLRKAMIHYRELFRDLLDDTESQRANGRWTGESEQTARKR
jgi:hypothetical protein